MRAAGTLLPDVMEICRGSGEKGAFLLPSERFLQWRAENAALMWVWRVSVPGVTLEEGAFQQSEGCASGHIPSAEELLSEQTSWNETVTAPTS